MPDRPIDMITFGGNEDLPPPQQGNVLIQRQAPDVLRARNPWRLAQRVKTNSPKGGIAEGTVIVVTDEWIVVLFDDGSHTRFAP